MRFIAQVVEECGGGVGIDWHGHRDRDLAVINSLAALEAGATRLHGAAIGIGERVGNTPMDTLLVEIRGNDEVWVRFQDFKAGTKEKIAVA